MTQAAAPTSLEIRTRAKRIESAQIRLARRSAPAFMEYVLRDERTGARIQMAPMHFEWHETISHNKRLILWSHVDAGKSSNVAIGRTLWEIGCNPNERHVLAGNTQGQACKSLRSVCNYIERSEALHRVFPALKPSLPWTQSSITVARDVIAKDPTLQALGVHGQVIGARIDKLKVDDILDWENTRTPVHREDLIHWWRSEIVGRLTDDAEVCIIGNAYTPDDLLHVLAAEGVYVRRTYSVLNDAGQVRWPEHWPPERLARVIAELGGEGHPEVARQLYCVPRSEASSRCQEAWVQRCLERGEGVDLLDALSGEELVQLGEDAGGKGGAAAVHLGVDIGVKKHARAGKSVVFGILTWPGLKDRQVVHCKSGRWGGPQTVAAVLDARVAYNAVAHVEDNAAQDFLLQAMHGEFEGVGDEGTLATILPFHTGGNKSHPTLGVESVFVELARGEWIIPSRRTKEGKLEGATPELREWIMEMLSYSPERHTGDHLMACWMAREGARLSGVQRREVGVHIVGQDVTDSDEAAKLGHPQTVVERLQGWQALLRRDRR